MFAQDDISEIHRLFPPEKLPRSGNNESLPLLVKTLSGSNFITAHSLYKESERVVTAAARVSIPAASRDLDVEIDVLLQLVRENPALALLSQDGNSIIPRVERDAIVKELEDMLPVELVSKADFTQTHDLHPDCLGDLLRIPRIKESLADDTDDYLLSNIYSTVLSDEMDKRLREGLDKNETIELRSQSLPGTPPTWLIRQRLDHLSIHAVDGNTLLSRFLIDQEADVIHCTPKHSILSQRDQAIAELRSGETFSLELGNFGRTFRELYQSSHALEQHLLESPSITIIDTYAVSTERLSQLAADAERKLDEQDYLDLNYITTPEIPREIKDLVRDNVCQKVMTTVHEDGKPIRRIDNYLLKDRVYSIQQSALLELAKTQASRQWDSLKDTPDKDPKFQMAEVLASISDDQKVLPTVAKQRDSEVAAAEQFSISISELESANENDFSMFWAEKVSLRVYNYREGLGSIDETKLREQLTELFSNYLQKDLLPDAISRTRSQGLVRSKKTRKNVNRFEATLKTSKSDLTSIISTLEHFDKKQGLSEPDAEAVEAVKRVSVQDMVRRMQKPKTDAPSMFLSLVVVLFAKHHHGVVYATGKFAPKLLKQLKTKISGEEYEQVEKWKEQAKAGTLSKEDRTSMVQMAEEAFR